MSDKPFGKNVALDFESELLQGRSDKALSLNVYERLDKPFERVQERSDKPLSLNVLKVSRIRLRLWLCTREVGFEREGKNLDKVELQCVQDQNRSEKESFFDLYSSKQLAFFCDSPCSGNK